MATKEKKLEVVHHLAIKEKKLGRIEAVITSTEEKKLEGINQTHNNNHYISRYREV